MSGLQKRMRRKLLLDAARQQRAATAGGGQFRRPLNSWVQTTKRDLVEAVRESERVSTSPSHGDDSPPEMTPR